MTEGIGGVAVNILDRKSRDLSSIPGCSRPIFRASLFQVSLSYLVKNYVHKQ